MKDTTFQFMKNSVMAEKIALEKLYENMDKDTFFIKGYTHEATPLEEEEN